MEKILKLGFRKAGLSALLFTASVALPAKLYSQDGTTFKITSQPSKQVIEKNKMQIDVFPVLQREIESPTGKRQAYMIAGLSVNIDSLSGDFVLLPNKYRVAFADIGNKYVKDELGIEKFADTRQMSKEGELLQKAGTDKYYWIVASDDFSANIMRLSAEEESLKMIHKLGYKEYRDEYRVLRFKSKTSDIRLDSRILAELKNDSQYISKLDSDQTKIIALVKQTLSHSKTLDRYISLYNVQRNRMSSADLQAWKNATASAQKLHNQIHAIGQKYDGNTSFTLLDKTVTKNLNDFLDNLVASKGVLGM